MNESININSIEEFRAYYDQELKEILEELSNNGVENIEGVEEVVKLFFDEYYQYLSVESASAIETIVANQQGIYKLRETQQLLEFSKDKSNKKYISGVQQALTIKNDGRRLAKCRSGGFEIGIDISYDNVGRIKNRYLSKNYPRLFSLIGTDNIEVSVGSIVYNGRLEQLKKLLLEKKTLNDAICEYKEQKREITAQIADKLASIPLTNLSYSLPSDLFDGFNQQLFKFICDKVYLNSHNMAIRIWDTENPPVEKAEQWEFCLGGFTKITDEVLREYLKEPISFGSFWKEGIIDDFLTCTSKWLEESKESDSFLEDKAVYSLKEDSKYRNKWLMWKKIYNFSNSRWFQYPLLLLGVAFGSISALAFSILLSMILSVLINLIISASINMYKLHPNEELFKKELKELLEQEISKMQLAHEKLVANRQKHLQDFKKELFSEDFSKLAQIGANIEKLREERVRKEQEIVLLSGSIDGLCYQTKGDNSELHAYILKRLIDKYEPRIVPRIEECSSLREDEILNYDIDYVPYCAVNIAYDYKMPITGPTITRSLKND